MKRRESMKLSDDDIQQAVEKFVAELRAGRSPSVDSFCGHNDELRQMRSSEDDGNREVPID